MRTSLNAGPSLLRCAIALCALCGVALGASCAPTVYQPVNLPRFATTAPRGVVLDALVRRAGQQGYTLESVDPVRGMFRVHARAIDRRSRRAQLRYGRRGRGRAMRGRARGGGVGADLFVVEVIEGGVRIGVVGPHVQAPDRPHPALARQLLLFGQSMRQAASDAGRGLSSVVYASGGSTGQGAPNIPPGYGGGASTYGGATPNYTNPGAAPRVLVIPSQGARPIGASAAAPPGPSAPPSSPAPATEPEPPASAPSAAGALSRPY